MAARDFLHEAHEIANHWRRTGRKHYIVPHPRHLAACYDVLELQRQTIDALLRPQPPRANAELVICRSIAATAASAVRQVAELLAESDIDTANRLRWLSHQADEALESLRGAQ